MQFATYKDSFLSALNRVSKIVKSNPRSVESLQCVKITSYAGQVYVSAVSNMGSAKVLIQGAKSSGSEDVLVDLDRLKDRVSKTSNMLKVEVDSHTLKITSTDDQRLGLAINDPREYPDVVWAVPEESYGLDKEELLNLFEIANRITNTTTALTPPFLQVLIRDNILWVANEASYQKFPIECNPSLEASVPTQTLAALSRFIQESEGDRVWLSQVGEDDIVVTVGNDQFQTAPLAVAFPELSPMFDRVKVMTTYQLTLDRAKLLSSLTKAKTSSDNYGRVTIDILGTGLTNITIQSQSPSGDWYEATQSAVWDGEGERSLTFNIETLTKFLSSYVEDKIILRIGDDYRGDLSPVYVEEGERSGIITQFRI